MDDTFPGAGHAAGTLPATRAACQVRLAALRDEIAALKTQIAATDLERQARRGRLDPRRFEQAKASLRAKLRESAVLAAHMATLPRRTDALKDCLIAVLRADYDDAGWQRALEAAHRRLARAEGA